MNATTKPAAKRVVKAAAKPATKAPVNALAALAAAVVATPSPAPAAAPVVALRGGLAVAKVAIKAGAVYRTKAPHNVAWWQALIAACATGPATVATLTTQPAQGGKGIPAHFVGYCIRRGYLVGA
jgi:hypothetical protein